MKVKVISLPYIVQVLYVLCFSRARYQVSVHRTIGPLVVLPRQQSENLSFSCSSLDLISSKVHYAFRGHSSKAALAY